MILRIIALWKKNCAGELLKSCIKIISNCKFIFALYITRYLLLIYMRYHYMSKLIRKNLKSRDWQSAEDRWPFFWYHGMENQEGSRNCLRVQCGKIPDHPFRCFSVTIEDDDDDWRGIYSAFNEILVQRARMNNRPCEWAGRPSWWRALTKTRIYLAFFRFFHAGYGSRNVLSAAQITSSFWTAFTLHHARLWAKNRRTCRLALGTSHKMINHAQIYWRRLDAILFSFSCRLFLRKGGMWKGTFCISEAALKTDKIIFRWAFLSKYSIG